jgi:hypothetical protein
VGFVKQLGGAPPAKEAPMRLIPSDISTLARIEIAPLEIEITGEEILADLLYPGPAGPGEPRA